MSLDRTVSIAPMMDYTDRHDRYFLRLIAPHALLYTEMVTAEAIMHGDHKRLLAFHPLEHPIALQLGGASPEKLAIAAQWGQEWGYDEINLNVGCPSDRVKSGKFGACLMLDPSLVAECVHAMQQSVTIPVTVKCRIGVDNQDSEEALNNFIQIVSNAGCQVFIIHARKAWLQGLSPKQNREIPPLCYERVWRLKEHFPLLSIVINGGIKTVQSIQTHLNYVDGVMIGREAYTNPYFLKAVEQSIFLHKDESTRHQIIAQLIPYIQCQLNEGTKISAITRHILGLFQGQKGARGWRRYISENAHKTDSGINIIEEALKYV